MFLAQLKTETDARAGLSLLQQAQLQIVRQNHKQEQAKRLAAQNEQCWQI